MSHFQILCRAALLLLILANNVLRLCTSRCKGRAFLSRLTVSGLQTLITQVYIYLSFAASSLFPSLYVHLTIFMLISPNIGWERINHEAEGTTRKAVTVQNSQVMTPSVLDDDESVDMAWAENTSQDRLLQLPSELRLLIVSQAIEGLGQPNRIYIDLQYAMNTACVSRYLFQDVLVNLKRAAKDLRHHPSDRKHYSGPRGRHVMVEPLYKRMLDHVITMVEPNIGIDQRELPRAWTISLMRAAMTRVQQIDEPSMKELTKISSLLVRLVASRPLLLGAAVPHQDYQKWLVKSHASGTLYKDLRPGHAVRELEEATKIITSMIDDDDRDEAMRFFVDMLK